MAAAVRHKCMIYIEYSGFEDMTTSCPWRLNASTSDEYNWALGNFSTANPGACSLVLTLTTSGPYVQSRVLGVSHVGLWLNITGGPAHASIIPSPSLRQSLDKHTLFMLDGASGGLSLANVNVSHADGGVLVDPSVLRVAHGTAVLNNSTFHDNTGYAGVMLASGGSSRVVASGCRFVANYGYQGGVGAGQYGAVMSFEQCEFVGNKAHTQGLAFFVQSQAALGLMDCSFDTSTNASQPQVASSGGAVDCEGTTWVEVSSGDGSQACHSTGPTHIPTLAPTVAPSQDPSMTPSTPPTAIPTILYPTPSPTPWGTLMPTKPAGPDLRPQVPSASSSGARALLWVLIVMSMVMLCTIKAYDSTRVRRPRRQEALLHTQLLQTGNEDEEDEGEVDFL